MLAVRLVLLSALAMSVGWGFRGDFGHETGAILPGALLGLAIVMASGRADWQRRATLVAMFCGLGWAIGGQMSYGIVIGYTGWSSLGDVAYGYASLFLIGALWGGIGAAALALSLTWPRSDLARFAWPLLAVGVVWLALDLSGWTAKLHEPERNPLAARWNAFDVDWLAALSALAVSLPLIAIPACRRAALVISILCVGWLAGFFLLVDLAGLRMTPPRSDNWAGCVGLFVAILIYLIVTRQRMALVLVSAGLLAGGFGFAIGDFWHMLGRGKWGPFGSWELLAGQNYWKWMEQFFGLVMGFGVALAILPLLRAPLEEADDDASRGAIDFVALLFLLVLIPWTTLGQNVERWRQDGYLPNEFLRVEIHWWMLGAAILVASVIGLAVIQRHRGALALAPESPLGRAQWLFLILLWGFLAGDFARALPGMKEPGLFSVHLSFWITAGLASLLALSIGEPDEDEPAEPGIPPDDPSWRFGWTHYALWIAVPIVIFALAWLTVASHEGPLPHSRPRFAEAA